MNRGLIALAAVAALGFNALSAGSAKAGDYDRMTVSDVHRYVEEVNAALNNPSMAVGRNFLMASVSDRAQFETAMNTYNGAGHPMARASWYAGGSAYAYRYPYYAWSPYYATTSLRSQNKWDMIESFENKKRLIPGYHPEMTITGMSMQPMAATAVVDVDLKEYSLRYSPTAYGLTEGVMHANSKCKMYVTKSGGALYLTRMDCNTNTNIPM